VAIVEKFALGGQVATLGRIENFPSQEQIDGFSLSQMFAKQIKHLQIEVIFDDVTAVDFASETKMIKGKKKTYQSKSVIIASGMKSVELGKNENDFLGRGVSFCVVCDANFYKNKPVCVASKNGSGIKGALKLAEICDSVTVLDSGDLSVYASANKNEKIKIVSHAQIEKIAGDKVVDKVVAKVDGKTQDFETKALFVELGKIPSTDLYAGQIDLDENGFIKTDQTMHTSANGVFAVGDVRCGFLKQIVTACSDGAIAGQLA
jgi:thioredoxin reductase (NADPH)